jgi:asparagine synthase (glutamine-hydrolysing)
MSRVEYIDDEKDCTVAIGCLSHAGTVQEIARSRTTITALNGSFYRRPIARNAEHVLREVHALPTRTAIREVTREIGGFSGLVAKGCGLYGFRDVNGLRPLYYARSRRMTAFASERKALWRIGVKHPETVPPGSAVSSTRNGVAESTMVQFRRPRERKVTFKQASATLRHLLSNSVRRITGQGGKVCVAFSGGLDSAVTAAMAKKVGVDVQAVSVGLVGSSEISTVDKFANQLGLGVRLETFDSGSIEEYVRRVLWLIEEPNLMKLSVAIPLHWAAMVAASCGCKVMLCGQGSDELYGGYSKYARILRIRGRRGLTAELYRSVIESSQVNYERDDQATSPFPVELRTPFADPDLIRFSLTIPSEFKVKDGDDGIRKWVLRDVARTVGVPEDIVWRRKKAIQHGTGVEKAIIKLAKSRGLQPDEYLSKTFEGVRSMESMP